MVVGGVMYIARATHLQQHTDIETQRGPLPEEEVTQGHTDVQPGDTDHQGGHEVLGVGQTESHQDEVDEHQDQVNGLDDVLLARPLGFLGDELADLHTDN